MHITPRRIAAAVTGATLSLALGASLMPAQADSSPSGSAGASWLAGQLTGGLMHNPNFGGFDDYGLTIDSGLALAELGTQPTALQSISTAIATHVNDYTEPGFGTNVSAGGTAKALVLAEKAGANPHSFGGVDLVTRLEARVGASGRISDDIDTSDPDAADFANTIGQAFSVEGLSAVASAKTPSATSYLLQQQCPAGFFRLSFPASGPTDQPCSTNPSPAPGPDVTGLAVLALVAEQSHTDGTSALDGSVRAALASAVTWLKATQAANGSFTDGSVVNTNSTGLAGWALGASCAVAAADSAGQFVRSLQVPAGQTGALAPSVGAVAYNQAALTAGQSAGITDSTSDQWRRATSQATPVLAWDPSAAPTVALTAPTGYLPAGGTATLSVTGASAGERVCLTGGTTATLTGSGGTVTRTVSLPVTTGTTTYAATTGPGSATATVSYLGHKKLRFSVDKVVSRGDTVDVKVHGLAAGEKVKIHLGDHVVAKGTANAQGLFRGSFVVHSVGRVKVKVFGQFADRKGHKTIRVVR